MKIIISKIGKKMTEIYVNDIESRILRFTERLNTLKGRLNNIVTICSADEQKLKDFLNNKIIPLERSLAIMKQDYEKIISQYNMQ